MKQQLDHEASGANDRVDRRAPAEPDAHERGAEIDYVGVVGSRVATSPPLLPSQMQSMSPPVGLGRECAHLEKMVKDAINGRSAVTGIHGLPGSGKSHLVDVLVSLAAGFTIIPLPLDDDEDLNDPVWSKAFENLKALEPEHTKPKGRDGATDQLRRSFAGAIRATGRRTGAPVLIVLEDCTEDQQPLAELIAGAVLDPELGATAIFVLTWRDDPDGSTLSFETPFPTHRLRPLTVDQSAEYLSRRIGVAPEHSVLTELWRATGGIPAAMLSACSFLTDEQLHGLVPFPDPVPIGSELVEAYGHWVDGLEGDSAAATTIAATALMSRPVLVDALGEADLHIDDLRPALDMKAVSILGDRVEFTHPLTRAAAFQRATSRLKVTAQRVVAHAYARAGQIERAALHAALSSSQRDDDVATMCLRASQHALERGDADAAARYEVLGARFAQDPEHAARHLIRASSLLHAAGRPDRAMECLRRVTPVNSSAAIVGHATYRAGRITFSTDGAPHSPAQMAAGAEASAAESPEDAVVMWADAAASAAFMDQMDEAIRYARQAVQAAGKDSSPGRDLAVVTASSLATLGTAREGALAEGQDSLVRLLNSSSPFVGSPQLAYVIGSAVVQSAPPVLVRRWFAFMNGPAGTESQGLLAGAATMVRAKGLLSSGRVAEAVTAANDAAGRFEALHDQPLFARALGWSTWALAVAGDAARAFQTASRFFALEPAITRSARLQVLAALAHCELQRGHAERARAWLRTMEDETVTRDGAHAYVDWPFLPTFLQLVRVADLALPEQVPCAGAGAFEGDDDDHLGAWTNALCEQDPAAALRRLDLALLAGPADDPILTAQMKMTSALLQHQLGTPEVARFNLSQAVSEFERSGAHGWKLLAATRLDTWFPRASGGASHAALHEAGPMTALQNGHLPLTSDRASIAPLEPLAPGIVPPHEIRLLGQFSVLRNGVPTAVPLGHAAQALKVVALFGRISVDELAELLWPGAEPGVGTRRLRNILWRIKSSSGDLLRRYDNFICLEEGVVTDVAVFEEAAGRAFKERQGADAGHDLARDAIRLYGGELLPSDRYADWATGPREGLAQLRLQLLDLMLAHALDSGTTQEAQSLLEDLIEADPYEERYYTQLATLHLDAGNRSRVRSTIARCERMLADLGVEPSKKFLDLVNSLQQD
ncbi:MAG TPA: BTAD domain-containing putative transcriptional regulator [Acidimicrobiales bacterium]|nr:BTAD domain-containing putative transcriptional regulator [Acidimicrobiales bacterium]